MALTYSVLWNGKDDEEQEAEITKTHDGVVRLDMVEGRFSGYPQLVLTRQMMKELRDALTLELGYGR